MNVLPTFAGRGEVAPLLNKIHHCDALELLRRLPNASVDMILTDPPYGNSNGADDLAGARARDKVKGGRQRGEIEFIQNDALEDWEVLIPAFFKEANRVIKPDGTIASFVGGGGTKTHFAQAILWLEEIANFFHAVIWDKSARGDGMGWRYRRNYEMVLIAGKKGHSVGWQEGRKAQPNVVRHRPPANELHPTQKPISLMEWLIENHTNTGAVVVDPFIGSGTTALAARQIKRHFIGSDAHEPYVQVSRRRLMNPVQYDLFSVQEQSA